jgi:hypothetical protein
MSTFVLAQVDAAIELFIFLIQHGAGTPRYQRNLQWLLKLRARALSKISTVASAPQDDPQQHVDNNWRRTDDTENGEDVELLGWRTRLIERGGKDRQTIRTIRIPTTPTDSHTTNISNRLAEEYHLGNTHDQLRMAEMLTSSASLPSTIADSTDELVRMTSILPSEKVNVP